MAEEVFELSDNNGLLNHIYANDNFKVMNGMAKNGKCILFCSSNGIYFPNNIETFRQKIICNDFYEWSRIASLLVAYVERIIFIRDVRKSFYVTGISEKYNSIDEVGELLEMYTQGYDLITAGNSAGGYMATIMGIKLNAKFVINIGGHWNLYRNDDTVERYYYLKKYKTDLQREKWYDLSSILENNVVPIFYLYGANNEGDLTQARCAKNIKNVHMIALNASTHAPGVSTEAYLRLLMANWEEIKVLSSMNGGRVIETDELEKQIKSKLRCHEFKISQFLSSEGKKELYLKLLYGWVQKKQNSQSIAIDKGNLAIWGKGKYCDLLLSELAVMDKVTIKCIIESQPLEKEYKGYPLIQIRDLPKDVELIIVIPYYDVEDIKKRVREYSDNVKIMGIDEFLGISN